MAMMARAIIREPVILIADSPFINLDERSSARALEMLKKLNAEGMTILLLEACNCVNSEMLEESGYKEIEYERSEILI
ncbi:hypothetical protein SDC9_196475 [bioreactor metagenome]|uniref:Uncharacterized protein n=1 Tax=bioreactor metagenome TaxID=1076179 RepID=A0A645INP5_9ZZZZ